VSHCNPRSLIAKSSPNGKAHTPISQTPIVTDDWPAVLPIEEAELELLRADLLDILAALSDDEEV
jgi:hypothetical protein